ncbi:efflux RND transporter periplasmic adaptor subunit [Variovorax sp. VNK109]|jgi:cobalt-zinc-cadmium efflux system membrane fusion protein|uniref:efflux RND transporter periplasmic adaptor subunit n=1 Tax=Variovorax sp. VNK109 TaxID=3400919 RepID=UPI003C058A90
MSTKLIIALLCAASFLISPAWAGPGHDHGDASPVAASNAPKRQPDGVVFLPKNSQRQLAVRTRVAEEAQTPVTVELSGKAVMDANAGGRVQPTQGGRLEAGPRGLPSLGQQVRKGEVLAVVRASTSAIERANQQALVAELRWQRDLARSRAQRLAQLEGTVPQKDIEAARAEADSLAERLAAISGSTSAGETLVAPVSGVISAANAVAGQVVDAREILFEIVDPARVIVEAFAFDVSLLADIGGASASPAAGVSVPLQFMGAGRSLREGAIPLQFRASGQGALPLAIGQPVKVLVRSKSTVKGFVIPASALVKSASNQDMVWVHTGAEVFEPRPVRAAALDGASVAVTDGIKAGERVVTQGAALINQVR